jgi:hypothetical protein
MSSNEDLGPYAPLIVAAIVIAVLVFMTPLEGKLVGIPLNWIAITLVGTGGILGTAENLR